MNDLMIPRDKFSRFFWEDLIEMQHHYLDPKRLDQLERLREQAYYKTGSLNMADISDVYSVFNYFKPRTVAEVGTFIGRSTMTIADAIGEGAIWTCDASNDLKLPPCESVAIRQFPKQFSTDMWKAAIAEKKRFEAFYIDGRLGSEDIELIGAITDFSGAMFVLDDFEGVEKGVANASLLLNAAAKVGGTMALIYPRAGGKTAVMLPFNRLRFVPQV